MAASCVGGEGEPYGPLRLQKINKQKQNKNKNKQVPATGGAASCAGVVGEAPYGPLTLLHSSLLAANCGNFGQQSSIFTKTNKPDRKYAQ